MVLKSESTLSFSNLNLQIPMCASGAILTSPEAVRYPAHMPRTPQMLTLLRRSLSLQKVFESQKNWSVACFGPKTGGYI